MKGQYRSNHVAPDTFFNKLLNTKKYMSFRWTFVLDPWKEYIYKEPWRDNMDQTLGQNLLEMLEKYNNEPYVFYRS